MQTSLAAAEPSQYIPAKPKLDVYGTGRIFRTCAYCRVSTDHEEQAYSLVLQKEHWSKVADDHGNWNLMHVFADEGITATSTKHRVQFNQMIEECLGGKYDLIVTKSVSRFARNVVDGIELARRLKNHNPPIGIFFESDNIFTLAEDSEMRLNIMFSLAQAESESKRSSMEWSLKDRFRKGRLLTPELYGYTRERDATGRYVLGAKLIPVESQASIVRYIYDAYLSGFTLESIARHLNETGEKTNTGSEWNSSGIRYILTNERYCGRVLTWKTFTVDVFDHKTRKNDHDRDQCLYEDDHEAIITVSKFEAVQSLMVQRRTGVMAYPLLHVIPYGYFAGYLPVNHRWMMEDSSSYVQASSKFTDRIVEKRVPKKLFSGFDFTGYQVAGGLLFDANSEHPVVSISVSGISFTAACTRMLGESAFIQILLHPTERKFAVRPSRKESPNSIRWRSSSSPHARGRNLSCPGLASLIYQLCRWNPDFTYRIRGAVLERADEKAICFCFSDSLPYAAVPEGTRRIPVEEESFFQRFGEDFYDHCRKYSAWYMKGRSSLGLYEESTALPPPDGLDLSEPRLEISNGEKPERS